MWKDGGPAPGTGLHWCYIGVDNVLCWCRVGANDMFRLLNILRTVRCIYIEIIHAGVCIIT